ncbi:Abi-alpha family protein [Nocardia stercoris]|nr:Abi-alpha family protein [Nocardia stercoris]
MSDPTGPASNGEQTPSSTPSRRTIYRPVTGRTTRRLTNPIRVTSGIVRVAVTAMASGATWGVGTAVEVGSTVVRGSNAGLPTGAILDAARDVVRESLLRALSSPEPEATEDAGLRERGADLLRRSANVHSIDGDHPAYARILGELAPDEARVLRLLYLDGPQPALGIRTGRRLTPGAQRYETGLNLIGEEAALRHPERVDHYLTNLRRLGLLEFNQEALGNPARYQLLESSVRKRLERAGFGTRVYYRSIELTGFGTDFVRTCLPVPPVGKAQ